MISLEAVSKSYDGGNSWAVRESTIKAGKGEITVLVGQSGCGKTTTLKMINRLVEPTSGRIHINDIDILNLDPIELRRSIGYVIQQVGLFPHMSVAENIAVVPHLLNWSVDKNDARVDELLTLVGLPPDKFRNRNVQELSGGQQQRVGFARALAGGPSILLMDEPFGALDPITRSEVVDEFVTIQKELKVTVVMVTHDMSEALLLADQIVIMKEGSVIASGKPPELIARPGHPYVQELLSVPQKQAARLSAMSQRRESD